MDAFTEREPEYTYWWAPSLEVMHTWNEDGIRRRFRDPGTQQFKVVDASLPAEGGRNIIAWARWDPPASMRGLRDGFVVYDEQGREIQAEEEEKRAHGEGGGEKTPAQGPPEGGNGPLFHELFGDIDNMREKWRARKMLTLTHICTRPAYHGHGVASSLLRSVLDVADAEGVPTYLESLRLPRPLYERRGFAAVDHLEYDLSRTGGQGFAVITIMIREPRESGVTAGLA